MDKRDIKILVVILLFAIVIIAVALGFKGLLKPKKETSTKSEKLGTVAAVADDYDYSTEYEPTDDEITEDDERFVVIDNIDLVFSILTLQAIEDIDQSLCDYLKVNGYDGKTFLTLYIIPSTINYEREFPAFEMIIDNDGRKIKAVYNLPEYKWQFTFR